jgi:hypothetical protein
VVIVTRLDRLARSTRDLLNIVHAIGERGAAFRSLHDSWTKMSIGAPRNQGWRASSAGDARVSRVAMGSQGSHARGQIATGRVYLFLESRVRRLQDFFRGRRLPSPREPHGRLHGWAVVATKRRGIGASALSAAEIKT